MEIIQKLNQKGRTVILVTHEQYTAEHARRIIKIKDGQIIGDFGVTTQRLASDGELRK